MGKRFGFPDLTKVPWWLYGAAAAALIIVAAGVEYQMGRVPFCECGYVKFWHGVVLSSENSQHLSDWYTFSHVIHGFGFYVLLWFVSKKFPMPMGLRLAFATALEAGWEVFENTPFVINRYRATTISLDYYGDSVLNSAMDALVMIVGFATARYFPVWSVVALAILMEAFAGYMIRDNLALNIVMLVYPFEGILRWQQGGG